jgi:hypothetical protein
MSYPIYVISKGRHDTRLTSKALEAMRVEYRIVVEPQERELYCSVIDSKKVLTLPFSNLGLGSIPARNWVWDHAKREGHRRHWILDDNISGFRILQNKKRIAVTDRSTFTDIEKFVDRFANVPMAGMQYTGFAVSESSTAKGAAKLAVTMNTRIYSCILLDCRYPHRWRGRYNEDTDLSLRFLKDGFCTILFNGLLCDKAATMTMKGGNTESLYQLDKVDGRLLMAQSLQRQHPDVCKIIHRWGRWQHSVNFRKFKTNKLRLCQEPSAIPA